MTDKFNWAEYTDEVDYATYSPEDDKIRIYSGRVPREMYDALREAKFNRAYKQGCFYAKWYPYTEDIALALCGEITDEDTSLFDRAEDRAGRFAGYSSNAEKRAETAIRAGEAAVNGIPLGQPILVGHHSERKHRRAVERAQREAQKVVEEVDRRDYWASRARGVLRHAEYKVQRGPTMRRIKKLESDKRHWQSTKDGKKYNEALGWLLYDLKDECAEELTEGGMGDYHGRMKAATLWATTKTLPDMPKAEARLQKWQAARERLCDRWLAHLEGQITYWKTLLQDEHDEDIDEQWPLEKGCWVETVYGWAQVVRVNRGAERRITSVSLDKDTFKRTSPGLYLPYKVEYERLKGWSKTEPEPEFKVDPTPHATLKEPDPLRAAAEARAQAATETEVQVNHDPDYYPTPPDVVSTMLAYVPNHVRGEGTIRILEPSAGNGTIIRKAMAWWPWAEVHWCETNYTARKFLAALEREMKGMTVQELGADFMEVETDLRFDVVLMNPPFSRNQWKHHVQKAYGLLKPGGRLVSIAPREAERYNTENGTFGGWIRSHEWDAVPLPNNAFESSGTNTQTHVLVIDK